MTKYIMRSIMCCWPFLQHSLPAFWRRDWRIICICLDPTLSAFTRKHFGYSSRSCCN